MCPPRHGEKTHKHDTQTKKIYSYKNNYPSHAGTESVAAGVETPSMHHYTRAVSHNVACDIYFQQYNLQDLHNVSTFFLDIYLPCSLIDFLKVKFIVTDEEYYQMPLLFDLDDYNGCLAVGGAYCLGSFELLPLGPHPLFRTMQVRHVTHH